MLTTLRPHSNSKPWFLFGAFLFPLLLLPFAGASVTPAHTLGVFAVLGMLHVLEIPAIYRLGDGRPMRMFGVALLLIIPAVIGDTAAVSFAIFSSMARTQHGCGTGPMMAVMATPFVSAAAHIAGGIVLAVLTAGFNRLRARTRPAAA